MPFWDSLKFLFIFCEWLLGLGGEVSPVPRSERLTVRGPGARLTDKSKLLFCDCDVLCNPVDTVLDLLVD